MCSTARAHALRHPELAAKHHSLVDCEAEFWESCAGATGTGKTVYVKSQLDALNTATYQNIQTAFSAQTSANQIQDIIDLKLDKRRKVTSTLAVNLM